LVVVLVGLMAAGPRPFSPLDLVQLALVPVIWGVNNVAAMAMVRELPPLFAVGLRFAIVLACLFWLLRAPPAGKPWLFVAMLACMGPVHFGLLFIGLGLARDLAPMVVALQLWAPASVMFAALLFGERVGALRWFGVGAAFLGAASLSFDPVVFAQWGALALAGFASVLYGLGSALVRRLSGAATAWSMQAWVALATAPTLLASSALFERGHERAVAEASWIAWASLGFGAIVSSLVANAFLFQLLRKYEVSRTTPYMLLTPVISFALGALVLDDHLTPRILIGAGVTMAGVALVAWAERRV
jgi:O-acetylserine/cysteine efflux transporter